MGNIQTVGPNEALIVSGGCFSGSSKKMVVGGWAWAWYMLTDVQRLSLEVMTLTPKCEGVETSHGVPLTVTGVAQCKVMTEKDFLSIAAEQFLGKDIPHIKSVILQTLEGHLRAILGTLTVEEIYRDRDQFASLVREVATPDVGRMGIEILSFTIKDVYDDVGYLASLGKTRIAEVKRDAAIGVSLAERDAAIKESECNKLAMDMRLEADTRIENSSRLYQLKKAEFDTESNTMKAQAEHAYELQSFKLQQNIRSEEMIIDLVENKKKILVEEKMADLAEKQLKCNVELPSEAEAYKIEIEAKGKRKEVIEIASAEAEKEKLLGSVKAEGLALIGTAEAEGMRMKASAYKQYTDAAILSLQLEALPRIAAEIAAPLAKTDEIVLINGPLEGAAGDLTRLVSHIPPAVHALTGVDLSQVLSKLPGARVK